MIEFEKFTLVVLVGCITWRRCGVWGGEVSGSRHVRAGVALQLHHSLIRWGPSPTHVFVPSSPCREAFQPNSSIHSSSMEAMPRPSVAPSLQLQLRPCPRWPRRKHCPPSSVASRRVACSASAADADVVDLFDAAKLTVSDTLYLASPARSYVARLPLSLCVCDS